MLFDNIAGFLAGREELIVKPEETLNVSKIIGMFYENLHG